MWYPILVIPIVWYPVRLAQVWTQGPFSISYLESSNLANHLALSSDPTDLCICVYLFWIKTLNLRLRDRIISWCGLCRIGKFLPYTKKDFNYLCHVSVEDLFPMKNLARKVLNHFKVFLDQSHLAYSALQWRHDECDGVSNHQPHGCLLNRLFRCRGNRTLWGECTGDGEFPAQRASNAENVSIWWRHHGNAPYCFS